jgi:catechol 2,3-dioxygenase-like lactoylglutathione lyase family enzyme
MPLTAANLVGFVSSSDAAQAREFYRDVLELQLIDETSFALVLDAHGTMLRVTIVERVHPAPYTVLGWEVADIARTVERLASRGVEFLRYEGMVQDKQGIWDSPSGGRIAWFRDPEQNILSLTQF